MVRPPAYFGEGNGAHACLRSHIICLERALMSGVTNVLMLEDDLYWEADVWPRLHDFLANVPADMDMCMLGGQHMKRTVKLDNGIYKCGKTHRTHAYLIKSSAINSLLGVWYGCGVHCDWILGDFMAHHPTYCPRPFAFAQGAGKSDINGAINNVHYW